jgi:glucose-1-phosphate adenylyltransferase
VRQLPPAKFVHEAGERAGRALNSLICAGAIVSGGLVRGSVLSPGVLVHDYALVEDSVLLDDVVIGAGAIVRRAIIDKNVVVPPGARIGVDHENDLDQYNISEHGVVVIGKGRRVLGPGARP